MTHLSGSFCKNSWLDEYLDNIRSKTLALLRKSLLHYVSQHNSGFSCNEMKRYVAY